MNHHDLPAKTSSHNDRRMERLFERLVWREIRRLRFWLLGGGLVFLILALLRLYHR